MTLLSTLNTIDSQLPAPYALRIRIGDMDYPLSSLNVVELDGFIYIQPKVSQGVAPTGILIARETLSLRLTSCEDESRRTPEDRARRAREHEEEPIEPDFQTGEASGTW